MQIKVEIEDELLEKAARLTGIEDANQLVARGLETLLAGGSALRFSLLRGNGSLEGRRRRPH